MSQIDIIKNNGWIVRCVTIDERSAKRSSKRYISQNTGYYKRNLKSYVIDVDEEGFEKQAVYKVEVVPTEPLKKNDEMDNEIKGIVVQKQKDSYYYD